MKCVILAGGEGLRLWPLSRKQLPKQFLNINSSKSLLFETIERNKVLATSFSVITNLEYRYMVENELEKNNLNIWEIFLEEIGRNTAPAIAIAALTSQENEIILVVPADAKIDNQEKYRDAINKARELAEEGYIVTFGIKPTTAHTGYGYIRYKNDEVLEFKEKPTADTARIYLYQGNYLWNSGMFMFKAKTMIEELRKYREDMLKGCVDLINGLNPSKITILKEDALLKIPEESIDYAVMEQSDKIKVIPSEFSWSDVGSLEALAELNKADKNGNTIAGKNIIEKDCEGTYIINKTENQLIVANELKDIVITNTNNALFVSKKGKTGCIKHIIDENKTYQEFFNENIEVNRPWGKYEVLVSSRDYKVKKIIVNPGKKISLQKHFFRTEHWTIVKGIATITLENETREYEKNESAYINIEQLHRLANNTDDTVEIIEVALGNNIIEEDIIRYDDDYERK